MTLWLLPLLPALGAALVVAAHSDRRGVLALLACATLGFALAAAVAAALAGSTASIAWSPALRLQARLVPASAVTAVLVPAVAWPVLLYAAWHEQPERLRRLAAWLLLFVAAMELLVIADDLLTLLIGWELVGACSWALIGHDAKDPETAPSAMFAFLATRLGDLGLFLAAFVTWSNGGDLAFAALDRLPPHALALAAAGALLAATAKSGQFPFSSWLFRAMAGPTSVSALLHAATMVAAGAYLLIRLHPMFAAVPWFGPVVLAVGALTALAGSTVAALQAHAKKLLAASTAAQFGVMFSAIGAGYPGLALMHLVAHACCKAPLFLAVGIAGEESGSYQLAGMRLGSLLPWVALPSGIAAAALAGLPPLGFAWTKDAITEAATHVNAWAGTALLLAGGLGAVYATRFQQLAFGKDADAAEHGRQAGAGKAMPADRAQQMQALALVLLAIATLAMSALQLEPVRQRVEALSPLGFHPGHAAQALLAPAVAALGVLVGWTLVRRQPSLGAGGPVAAAGDWLGLPTLIARTVVRPVNALAVLLARSDDRIDADAMALARRLRALAGRLARLDESAIDRGTERAAAAAESLAAFASRFGEWVADGLAVGPAQVVAQSGHDLRPLQGGMSHRYLAWITGGAALLVALLLAWS